MAAAFMLRKGENGFMATRARPLTDGTLIVPERVVQRVVGLCEWEEKQTETMSGVNNTHFL